jgi:hypothetical protein
MHSCLAHATMDARDTHSMIHIASPPSVTRDMSPTSVRMLCAAVCISLCGVCGAAIGHDVHRHTRDVQEQRNREAAVTVFAQPCYADDGCTQNSPAPCKSALVPIDDHEGETSTMCATLLDTDIIFVPTPPLGQCGPVQTFWVVDGYASHDFTRVTTSNLTSSFWSLRIGACIGICVGGLACSLTWLYANRKCARNGDGVTVEIVVVNTRQQTS